MENIRTTIIGLLESVSRSNMGNLIEALDKLGFFSAPASTRFHGSFEGGLARHSLAVFRLLSVYLPRVTGRPLSVGQRPLSVLVENVIVAALLHDVCKVGAYIGTQAPYTWNKRQPKGHATLSIARIKEHIKLEPIEELMIRYHMGLYGLNEFYEPRSWEFKTNAEYPLRGDHSNDKQMTKEESQKARYGKSLRNAWYHNPIVKMMYLCDELSLLGE